MAERQQEQETGGEYCGTGRDEELLLCWETVRQGDMGNYSGLGDSKTRRQQESIGEQREEEIRVLRAKRHEVRGDTGRYCRTFWHINKAGV